MFGCTPAAIKSIADEIKKDYQVGLRTFCSDNAPGSWYCVSINEYNRLKGLPQSCETINITTINGATVEGIINSDSFLHGTHNCIS